MQDFKICVTLELHLKSIFMPTVKNRIYITLPDVLHAAIERIAERDRVRVATKTLALLQQALEIEEDAVLDAVSAERVTKDVLFLTHDQVWS